MSQIRIIQVLVVATMLLVQGCVTTSIGVYDTGGPSPTASQGRIGGGFEIDVQADVPDALIKHPLYASAMADYESENYQQALEKFNQIIEDLPLCAQAYNIRGCIYHCYAGTFGPRLLFDEKGNLEKGFLGLPKATRMTSKMKKQMISFCDSAIADFYRAIELEPEFAQAYNNRGQTTLFWHMLKGKFGEYWYKDTQFKLDVVGKKFRIKFLIFPGSAAKDLPGITNAHRDFTIFPVYTVYLEDLDLEGLRSIAKEGRVAMADFFIVTTLDPANAQAYLNKGSVYVTYVNKYSDSLALENFDKAITLDPQCTRVYICRASLLSNNFNRHAEAKKDLDKAIELEPSLTERGDIQMLKSQIEKKLGH